MRLQYIATAARKCLNGKLITLNKYNEFLDDCIAGVKQNCHWSDDLVDEIQKNAEVCALNEANESNSFETQTHVVIALDGINFWQT